MSHHRSNTDATGHCQSRGKIEDIDSFNSQLRSLIFDPHSGLLASWETPSLHFGLSFHAFGFTNWVRRSQ